jgi:predicted nucleic acid-binding Zn ribbon protein
LVDQQCIFVVSGNTVPRLETLSICAKCGKEYSKYKRDQRFCSDDCRVRGWHQKRSEMLSSALERIQELEQTLDGEAALPKRDLFS